MQLRRSILTGVALLGLAWMATTAHAQGGFPTITVDENGNGTIDFGLGPGSLSSSLTNDPGPGGLNNVLTYNLGGPPALVAGDVGLVDADFGGAVLDVIRFNPAGTGGDPNYPASLVFYSDNVDGFDSIGDTPGPPTANYTNALTLDEVTLADGSSGAIYTPGPNDPGFVPGFAVTYVLVSDSVPEPGTLALLLTSGIGGGLLLRRRNKK